MSFINIAPAAVPTIIVAFGIVGFVITYGVTNILMRLGAIFKDVNFCVIIIKLGAVTNTLGAQSKITFGITAVLAIKTVCNIVGVITKAILSPKRKGTLCKTWYIITDIFKWFIVSNIFWREGLKTTRQVDIN